MSIESAEAEASLRDIEGVMRRTRSSLIYRRAGSYLILWGIVTSLAYLTEFFLPAKGATIWLTANAVGVIGMVAINFLAKPNAGGHVFDLRLAATFTAIVIWGLIWVQLLGVFSPRALGAFWPTLFMLGYVVAGIWFGSVFIYVGLSVTTLTLASYLWAGDWFALVMAIIEGMALIGGGLWLMRRG